MLKINFSHGMGLIYNVEDWYELRTKHKIVGDFFGNTKHNQISLPVILSSEQIYVLAKRNIIEIVTWPKLQEAPLEEDRLKYEQDLKEMLEEQKVLIREEKLSQINHNIDQIIKGKMKEYTDKDIKQVIEEEMNKLPDLEVNNLIVPIYLQHRENLRGNSVNVALSEIEKHCNKTKLLIFEDLWEKGYYVSSGKKFGGDFLVYLEDPIAFHALYIVKCIDDLDKPINATEIVQFGRLSNSVKKKFVLAGIKNQEVKYITLSWIDSDLN